MAAKPKIKNEVFVMPSKTGLSYPAFTNKKTKHIPKHYKGIAG